MALCRRDYGPGHRREKAAEVAGAAQEPTLVQGYFRHRVTPPLAAASSAQTVDVFGNRRRCSRQGGS